MRYILPVIILFLLLSCDEGIGPVGEREPTGFSGTITFLGDWPSGITRTHIVLFKNPLNSTDDFNFFNIKYVSQEIPYGSDTLQYNTTEPAVLPESGYLASGVYSYLAVAQSKTIDLSLERADWVVVGLYFANGSTTQPGTVTISEGVVLDSVNIICDFDNSPPQPPGGN